MGVRLRLRLLDYVKKVFPVWALTRQINIVDHSFDAEESRAKTQVERDEISYRRQFEVGEYVSELDELRSWKLLRKARSLYIPVEDLTWQDGGRRRRALTYESESRLYHSVQEEIRKRWDFRFKFVSLLIGLIGALIGMIAILKK
jgi:hypothetical protein